MLNIKFNQIVQWIVMSNNNLMNKDPYLKNVTGTLFVDIDSFTIETVGVNILTSHIWFEIHCIILVAAEKSCEYLYYY